MNEKRNIRNLWNRKQNRKSMKLKLLLWKIFIPKNGAKNQKNSEKSIDTYGTKRKGRTSGIGTAKENELRREIFENIRTRIL